MDQINENFKYLNVPVNHILDFLSNIDLMKKFSLQSLKEFSQLLTPFFVLGGTTIIEKNAKEASLYFLYHGRLRVYVGDNHQDHKEFFLAEISQGEFVGEIALLTNLPRTTTVKAVRDSVLFKLDEQGFEQFSKNHPEEVIEIAKTALKRLAVKKRPLQIGENFITLAICPAGSSNHQLFTNKILEELNQLKSTRLVSSKDYEEAFGKDILSLASSEIDYLKVTEWMQGFENEYDCVIYQTDGALTDWTKRCLRQADRVIFVAEHSHSAELNPIELYLISQHNFILPLIEIVFIHPDERNIITGTDRWLKNRPHYHFHHLKLNSKKLFDRFMRILTGKAFGVVFNGGSARAIAHTGVLQALEELNIPIDFVAGASMGSVIGLGYCSHDIPEIVKQLNFFSSNFKFKWTFPLISLITGKSIFEQFYHIWHDSKIEDLWTRCFCVSTNLTESQLKIHDRGEIRLAIQASISIPAILPPLYDSEGDMLVDGGIMNNMPVDIMRKMICGGEVLAVNCYIPTPEIVKRKKPIKWLSGWSLFFQKINPFRKEKLDYDDIVKIIINSISLSISFKQKQMGEEADYLLELDTQQFSSTDFKAVNQIIEFGYQEAMKKLPVLLQKD